MLRRRVQLSCAALAGEALPALSTSVRLPLPQNCVQGEKRQCTQSEPVKPGLVFACFGKVLALLARPPIPQDC